MRMKNMAKIEVRLMNDIKNTPPFNKLSKLNVTKVDIFRLGILTFDPPTTIKEDDFEYQQSKAPYLQKLYEDYISLTSSSVITNAQGETGSKVSEIIGVGVGLAYAVKILKIIPNKIKRILIKGKGKRLDFEVIKRKQRFEIETRSTSYKGSVNKMMNEVLEKKAGKPNTAMRFGTVTLSRTSKDKDKSFILVGDDNDFDQISEEGYSVIDYLRYYLPVFSFAMDSHYYNMLSRQSHRGKFRKNSIKIQKFRKKFEYKNTTFLGEAFDRRLIMEKIRENATKSTSAEVLLRKLTSAEGVHQIFIGVDERLVKLFNEKDLVGLNEYEGKIFDDTISSNTVGSVGDGTIFAEISEKSPGGFRELLTRNEVKERLSMVLHYLRGDEKPECGAPCRSREIEGKPCEIRTYRGHCHFHR